MTCKFIAVKDGLKIPSSIYFTEVPFHPIAAPNYFVASFKDDTNIEMNSFYEVNINDLFRLIKVYLDENNILLSECIKPHIRPSFYTNEVDKALQVHFNL